MDTRQSVELLAAVACILSATRKNKYGRRYGRLLCCLIMHRYTMENGLLFKKAIHEVFCVELHVTGHSKPSFQHTLLQKCIALFSCLGLLKNTFPLIFNRNFPCSSLNLCGLGEKGWSVSVLRSASVHHSRLALGLYNTDGKLAVSNWWWLKLDITTNSSTCSYTHLEFGDVWDD